MAAQAATVEAIKAGQIVTTLKKLLPEAEVAILMTWAAKQSLLAGLTSEKCIIWLICALAARKQIGFYATIQRLLLEQSVDLLVPLLPFGITLDFL